MECEAVRRAISDGDGRTLRARKIRAHMRACPGCRDFETMIRTRTAELHTLAPPLPAVAATAMLARLLTHGAGGGHSGVAAATSGAALGNHVAMSVTVKALAAAAIVSAATAGAVHIAASPDRHGPNHAPTQPTPRRSGAAGAQEGAHASPGAALRPGSAAKAHGPTSVKSGHAPVDAGGALGAAAPIGGQHGRAGREIANGRGRSAGGSSTHAGRRPAAPRSQTGRGHRSPGPGQPAPTHRTGREGSAQRSAPAAEHVPARGWVNHPLPSGETESPVTPSTAAG